MRESIRKVVVGLLIASIFGFAIVVRVTEQAEPEEPIQATAAFVPSTEEPPKYDDLYLEYCACPADAEAIEVIYKDGTRVDGDPDSCPTEIPLD